MDQMRGLLAPITSNEVWLALQSIWDTKAPGPNRFSYKFYKVAWGIIGHDIVVSIQDFFLENIEKYQYLSYNSYA